jgi:ubiquinone biosynthesis protein Coq4
MTVEEAREQYFAANGFSTAAYSDRWVHVRIGPLPFAFPNFRSRRRAIPFHDLHHVATGYATTWRGEAEIGAWEIAATFGDRGARFWAAWLLNSIMFTIGLVIAPRRVIRAFRRGRKCTSVYRIGVDEALALDVDELRRRLGLS